MNYYRTALAIGLVSLFYLPASAQDSLNHTRSKFVSTEGKLYWPGNKALYLFVDDNPEGSDLQRLKSETTPTYADPMYLDTEGVNYIRSKWAMDENGKYATPEQEVVFEIYKDSYSPETKATMSGAPKYVNDGTTYYGKGLSLALNTKDQLSGVNTILISYNKAPFQPYGTQINPDQDGKYAYTYYAVDNVGNAEAYKEINFIVDVTAPKSNHRVVGEHVEHILSPLTKIALKSLDGSSDVKSISYHFDEKTDAVYSSDLALNNLTEGEHSITYFGTDNVLNKEEAKTYAFYLDKTPPEVEITVIGDQYQSRGRVFVSTRSKIKLSASDNKSGLRKITYQIGDREEKNYTEPFDMPQSQGTHEIKFYAEDNVGNTYKTIFDQSKHGRQALDLDMVVPEINFSFSGSKYFTRDTMFITSKTPVSLSATDKESGVNEIGYKINGGNGMKYGEPFYIQEEGIYKIDYYATDFVNNRNIGEFFFVIDNTGPEIEAIMSMEPIGKISLNDLSGDLKVYSAGVKLYLGATDKKVDSKEIYYTLNDQPETIYGKPISITTKGINTFKIRAVDMLGNETVSEETQIFIK